MHALRFILRLSSAAALAALALLGGTTPAHAVVSQITVDSNADNTTSGNGLCTLREAINNANNNGSDTTSGDCEVGTVDDEIVFAGNYTITLASMLPGISDPVKITGNGPSNTIIQGNAAPNAAAYRIMHVSSTSTTWVSGVTIRNGGCAACLTGGGIMVENGVLELNNSVVDSNYALFGAGIFSTGGAVTINNSTLSNNHAVFFAVAGGWGGGIHSSASAFVIRNSTLSSNSAIGGGAIFSDGGDTLISNSTIAGNTGGRGLYLDDGAGTGPTTLTNSIVAGNTGGDCLKDGSPTLTADAFNLDSDGSCDSATQKTLAEINLGPLTDNGGPTPTMALQKGSQAIDAGNNTTCEDADQRGINRPQDGDLDGTPDCDPGSAEGRAGTKTFRSVGSRDGWVRETGEFTDLGGLTDAFAPTFRVGDETGNRQYRSILSFSTSSLDDSAAILSATLKFRREGQLGANPFATLGSLRADVRKGPFSSNPALQNTDFQAAASKANVLAYSNSATWFTKSFTSGNLKYINKAGLTQFRLHFTTDDNNNGAADYVRIYSGDAPAASRPRLIIQYYIP